MKQIETKLVDALEAAIEGAYRQAGEGALVASWCLVVETVDVDGTHSLSRFWPAHLSRWQRRGMLGEALDESPWYGPEEEDAGA